MAVAAPEVAEGLSPEASQAVSAAAAGRGRKLSPEVAKELRRRAARKPKAASSSSSSSDSGDGGGSVPSKAAGAAVNTGKAGVKLGGSLISGGAKGGVGTLAKVIFAFGAGLLALELASYVSGRYFTWNLNKGKTAAQTAAKSLDLYPGQSAKLTSANLPVSNGQPAGVVGTRLV